MSEYAVVNPFDDECVSVHPTDTNAQIEDKLARAATAQRTWAQTDASDRVRFLSAVANLHLERQDELAAIIGREMGKPIRSARGEVSFCAAIYQYYADHAEQMLADEELPLLAGEGSAVLRRDPFGVVLGIMPWNYPYYQIARFAAPNLANGNAVLLKPAPQCPESAQALDRVFADAGLASGLYSTVYASNEQVATLIADPRVRGVSVTGSERAGSAVAEIAGRHLKKVVLELGGSDPFIVLSTDDLDATVAVASKARLSNAGQACNSAKRFIVADDLYESFVIKLKSAFEATQLGDPSDPGTTVGPLSSKAAADRIQDQVQRAIGQGATLVTGGERNGNFFRPTLLTDVSPTNDAYHEELFGPVAVAYRAASEEDAIALANDTLFGLGSYVFTTDPQQAARVADRLEAGMVFINVTGGEGAELPFGGVKRSGFGRELGRLGMDEFTNKKLIRSAG